MKKELEFLYEGNCNENPFVFETPELQEQMDSVFSYFQIDLQYKCNTKKE